jgi:outer membrane protein assembly factor BamB
MVALVSTIAMSQTPAFATTPTLSLSVGSGVESSALLVGGSGFSPGTRVDVYFDSTDVGVATANQSGAFASVGVQAPTLAVPGNHWITGVASDGLFAQRAFSVSNGWNQAGFGTARLAVNPYENVLGRANVSSLTMRWQTSSTGSVVSSPTVTGGVVYAASLDGSVYAVNATTGRAVWTTNVGSPVSSSPELVNGLVFVGSQSGQLAALSPRNGSVVWTFQTGGAISSAPLISSGIVYVGSGDGNLDAMNASTGALLWQVARCARCLDAALSVIARQGSILRRDEDSSRSDRQQGRGRRGPSAPSDRAGVPIQRKHACR